MLGIVRSVPSTSKQKSQEAESQYTSQPPAGQAADRQKRGVTTSRVPFEDDMEREEDLLAKYIDKTGRYVDPDFPPEASSLFLDPKNPPAGHIPVQAVRWLRPHEFVTGGAPVLFAEGSQGESIQGSLGDNWFLSALSCIQYKRELLDIIIPSSGNGETRGIYTIRFFKYGQWKNVVIDDRIPCDPTNTPLYGRSKIPNEIWISLVEKAYAKLHGSYESLCNGTMTYALRDLTGGAPQTISLREEEVQDLIMNGSLWLQLKLWVKQGLLGCSQAVDDPKKRQSFRGGFRSRRLYGIVDAQEPVAGQRFLRVETYFSKPHQKWTGKWGDEGPEWKEHPQLRVMLQQEADTNSNRFWITFEDFTRYFDFLYVCQLFPPSWKVAVSTDPNPEPLVLEGRWNKRNNLCGGSPRKGNATWYRNPQYRMVLTSGERTQVFITLSQEDRRYKPVSQRANGQRPFEKPSNDIDKYSVAVGFVVVRKKKLEALKSGSQLKKNDIELISRPFRRHRDATVSKPKVLEGGPKEEFIIIPMVYDAKDVVGELRFWLSIAASKEVKIEPISPDNLVEPQAANTGDDSDEESDNDYEEKQLLEPFFEEFQVGGSKFKGRLRDRRTPEQIQAACASLKAPFEDADFPVGAPMLNRDPKSLNPYNPKDFHFLRPCWTGSREPAKHMNVGAPPQEPPLLFPESGTPGVIKQGMLANNWLLGAMATVSTKLDLLKDLFVNWDTQYGVFTVRVFKNGKWMEVTIDDRLPCRTTGLPYFAVGLTGDSSSDDPKAMRILWVSLLEKAYAKVHGCYENLAKGTIPYGLRDLTGGAPQSLPLYDEAIQSQNMNGTLWRKMLDWAKSGCLIAVKFGGGDMVADSEVFRRGVTYPILDVREIEDGSQVLRMIQLLNPWPTEELYGGKWAVDSKLWAQHREAESICRPQSNPFTFWMQADEGNQFEKGEFFRVFGDGTLFVNRIFPRTWTQSRMKSFWTKESSHGPPFQPQDLKGAWLSNPQFELHVTEIRTLCFISVSQADVRMVGESVYRNSVGFIVVPRRVVREKGPNVSRQDFLNPPPIEYKFDREASLSYAMTLDPKDSPYIVVTFSAEKGAAFKPALGPVYLSVWHNKPILVRGGQIAFEPDETERDPDQDLEDPLEEEAQPVADHDPKDEMLTVQGTREQASVAQKSSREEQEKDLQGLEAAAGAVASKSENKDDQKKKDAAKLAQATAQATQPGGGGGFGGGAPIQGASSIAAEHIESADASVADRQKLMDRIAVKLPKAQKWQLQAVLKLLD